MKKQPKHIDIIVKYFYPVTAGIETNILETYSLLTKKGWDVHIHTSKDEYLHKNVLKNFEIIRGLKVKRYTFTKIGYWPKIDWNASDIIALHNFDVFPHFWILTYSLTRRLLRKRSPKIILTPHGGFTPEWRTFPKWQVLIKGFYHFTLGTFLINSIVDKVRAVSDWEAEEIEKKLVYEKLITVISNGVEDEAYITSEKNVSEEIKRKVKFFDKYIIQIGRIYPIKNYETTLRAMTLLPKNITYVIVGPIADAKYFEYLKKLVLELDLEERVVFLGVMKGLDKFYLIRHAQMMVHMALWESFCNVVHEGLSQGLICIVSNTTALPYLVKDDINGYIVDIKDWESEGKKINYVLANLDTKKFREMKHTNKIFGLKDSWATVSEKMNDLYSTILNPSN